MSEKNKSYWVKDDEKVRGMHGRTVAILNQGENLGVCRMSASFTDSDGNENPGFVQLSILPDDLNAGINWERILTILDRKFSSEKEPS